jgi:hypothetical protein
MVTHTYVEFRIPEADLFASLIGVRNDLRSTQCLCNYLDSQFGIGYPPMEITDAFSSAILIRYFRAFPPLGVRRWPWGTALETLPAELKLKHDALYHLRSKHFAHSVSELEEHRLQARYTLERFETEGITYISAASYTLSGLSSQDVSDIRALCASLLGFVEDALVTEGNRLLPIVRGMTLDQLQATIPPLTSPGLERAHVPRERP